MIFARGGCRASDHLLQVSELGELHHALCTALLSMFGGHENNKLSLIFVIGGCGLIARRYLLEGVACKGYVVNSVLCSGFSTCIGPKEPDMRT